MDGVCHHPLPRSRLAEDQDGRIGGRRLPDPKENVLELVTASNDLLEARLLPELLAQVEVLLFKTLLEILDLLQPVLELLVGAFPGECVDEDLGDQLQPLHQRAGPVTFRPRGIEAQGADGRLVPCSQRDGQIGLDPEMAVDFRVAAGFRRQLLYCRKGNDASGQHLLLVPGEVLRCVHPFGKERLQGAVEVGEQEGTRGFVRPLPKPRNIKPQTLADAALGIHDFAVYPFGRHVDETSRDLGQDHLEPELFLQIQPVLPALQGIDRDLSQQAQPGNEFFRPDPFVLHRIDGNRINVGSAGIYRDQQSGSSPPFDPGLPVRLGLGRQLVHARNGQCPSFFEEHFVCPWVVRAGKVESHGDTRNLIVRIGNMGKLPCRPVPGSPNQAAAVDLEKLENHLQCILDLPVEPLRRHVDEPRRNVRQKAFEAKAFLQCIPDLFLLIQLFVHFDVKST